MPPRPHDSSRPSRPRRSACWRCSRAPGYERVAPAIIQPAGVFLDVVGESLRARTYVFTDPDGEELCLRPDLTVPTCRLYLDRHADGQRAGALLLQRLGLPLSAGGRRPRAPARVPPGRHRVVRRRRPRAGRCRACWPSLSPRCARPASAASGCASAISACSRALLDALPMPERWRRRLAAPVLATGGLSRRAATRFDHPAPHGVRALPRELVDRLDPADAAALQRRWSPSTWTRPASS